MKALFVAYGGGHMAMVLPVLRALRQKSPGVRCVLLALTTGYALARQAGEAPMGYRDFLHLTHADEAQRWGERLSVGMDSPDVAHAESVAYFGVNYLDLQQQHGDAVAAQRFANEGRFCFLPLNFMHRLIASVQPDVVVATNAPRSEQAALQVAAARGIPTVGMVDLFGLDSDPYVHRAVKPLRTCVLSAPVRERLLARGFPAGGVKITGNPAFDGLLEPSNREAGRDWRQRQGWQDKRVILNVGASEPVAHAATGIPAGPMLPVAVENILRGFVRQRPQWALIQRYHPAEWSTYARLPDEARVHFSVPPLESIHPLIHAADMLVCTNSTVALEARIAGKMVVSIENSPSVHHWFSMADMGVSYPCPTHQDLPAVLEQVAAAAPPLPPVQAADGAAAMRVADVILEVAARAHG